MNTLARTLSVFRFELLRTLTLSRIAVWFVLVLFPPSIIFLILMGDYWIPDEAQFGMPLLVLIPQVMTLLGLLLWASPVVYSELEGKTWSYLAVRPGGKTALLLGKYLAAVCWTSTACWLSLMLVVGIASVSPRQSPGYLVRAQERQMRREQFRDRAREDFERRGPRIDDERQNEPRFQRGLRRGFGMRFGGKPPDESDLPLVEQPWRMLSVYALLVGLSNLGYAALFVFIGTVFHRRAMVVAVAYALISEFTVTLIPAVIREFTFAYHLRCLMVAWMDWTVPIRMMDLFSIDESVLHHIVLLLGITIGLLVAANFLLHRKEYITAQDV